EPTVTECCRECEAWADRKLRCGVRRLDQDEGIAQEVDARSGLDQVALIEVIHPGEVGRYEEVGRSTCLDLPRERVACAVGDHDAVAGGRLEALRLRVRRLLEACGGEYGDARGMCDRHRCGERNRERNGRDRQREAEHGPSRNRMRRRNIPTYTTGRQWRQPIIGASCMPSRSVSPPGPLDDDRTRAAVRRRADAW